MVLGDAGDSIVKRLIYYICTNIYNAYNSKFAKTVSIYTNENLTKSV